MENIRLFILDVIVVAALCTDITRRRIPNILILPGIVAGLLFNAYSGWDSFLSGIEGMVVGTALMFVPFAFGGIGGGDVKLLACIGAFMGTHFVLLTALYMALAGGVIALLLLLQRRLLGPVLFQIFTDLQVGILTKRRNDTEDSPGSVSFPYAIAIAIGYGITVIGNW
jgi:prepilin peptidase CpaA